MRTRNAVLAAVVLCLVLAPATASAGYVIVLKGGKKVTAREAPKFANGQALYYATSGTYSAVPESLVDRTATEAANAAASTAPAPGASARSGVKLGDTAQQKLRRLERSAQPGVAAVSSSPGYAATSAGASASYSEAPDSGAGDDNSGSGDEGTLLEMERQRNERVMKDAVAAEECRAAKEEYERYIKDRGPRER